MGQEELDVLVIGAGPAGCAAGIAAARAGARGTVLDQARFPRDKVCGDALSNEATALLAQLGVEEALLGVPHAQMRRGAAVLPDGSRIEREYLPYGVVVRRFELDQCLRLQLSAAGAEVIEDVKVTGLLRDGATVVGVRQGSTEHRGKVVIAADGYGSVAWSLLAPAAPRGRELAVSATAYVRGVDYPDGSACADHYFSEALPCGYGWVFPAVEGVANVGVYVRADAYARLGQKPDALLQQFMRAHPERFARAEVDGKVRVWSLPLAPRGVPRAAPGLLLVGDAAGLVDPLSGEGIWQALHSGAFAGELAARAAARGGLGPAQCAEYERFCRREVDVPSRRKRWVQDAMCWIVARKAYRWPPVFAMLKLAYRHHVLEMTKS